MTKEEIKAKLGLGPDATDQEVINAIRSQNPQAGPGWNRLNLNKTNSPHREDVVTGQRPGKGE